MFSRKSKKPLGGFTLIELLVVIAIIAILAAILFPVFAQAREAARKASCQSNLKQFATAFAMYRSDFDERYPFGGWYDGSFRARDRSNDWHIAIYPYVKNAQVYFCPSSTDIHSNPPDWNRTSTDYLYNNFLAEGRNGINDSAIVAPADCILVAEGHSDWGREDNATCITPFSNGQVVTDVWCTEYTLFGRNGSLITGSMWGGAPGETKVWGLPRHSGGANMAFADGHVKYIQALDARSAADTRAKLQGRVPWQRNGDPTQSRNSPWDAQF